MSFVEWRTMARMKRALEQMAEGFSVTDTAIAVGYDSVSPLLSNFGEPSEPHRLSIDGARAALHQSAADEAFVAAEHRVSKLVLISRLMGSWIGSSQQGWKIYRAMTD